MCVRALFSESLLFVSVCLCLCLDAAREFSWQFLWPIMQLSVPRRVAMRTALMCRVATRTTLVRRVVTAASQSVLPVIRVPAILFPGQCISLPILDATAHTRPPWGSVGPALVDEAAKNYAGKVAVLADGWDVGCVADVRGANAGYDREPLCMPTSASAEGDTLHLLGGEQRVRLLHTGERTSSGVREASFASIVDASLRTDELRALSDEAIAAHALLAGPLTRGGGGGGENWSFELCTVDDELMSELMEFADPTAHPLFFKCAEIPEDATPLAWWLASRLPLSTAFRAHLLRLDCPLKRMRDVVDALRLLVEPQRAASPANRRFGKFDLLWQTAEASGCELEAPKCVVHWRGDGDAAISRY